MQKTRQIDVTKTRETLADLVRKVRENQPVELMKGGLVVARVVSAAGSERVREVPRREQEQAWKRLQKLQQKTGRAMKKRGITEADVMRDILEDD